MQADNQLPSPVDHPNLFAWYSFVSKFTQAVMDSWPEGKAQKKEGEGKKKQGAHPQRAQQ